MPPPPGSPPRRSDRGRCLLALVAALALALIAAALGVDLRPRDAVFAGGARSPAPRGRPGSRAAGGRVRRPRARGAAAAPPPASESPAPPPDPHAARPDPFVVPNVVHFIFGLDPTFGHIKFGLIHYLALVGTALHIRPDEIRWHYKFLPANNSYWECAAPLVTLVPEEDVTTVHGRPLKMRVQHRADIIRMQIMLNDGGMYLDSDVVPLKSWEDLRHTPLSMGLESDAGLCNAVMVGAPNTTFIRRWWAEYARFDPDAWAYHSVHLPRELQRAHPLEVAVLQERAFFAPSWMQLTPMYDREWRRGGRGS